MESLPRRSVVVEEKEKLYERATAVVEVAKTFVEFIDDEGYIRDLVGEQLQEQLEYLIDPDENEPFPYMAPYGLKLTVPADRLARPLFELTRQLCGQASTRPDWGKAAGEHIEALTCVLQSGIEDLNLFREVILEFLHMLANRYTIVFPKKEETKWDHTPELELHRRVIESFCSLPLRKVRECLQEDDYDLWFEVFWFLLHQPWTNWSAASVDSLAPLQYIEPMASMSLLNMLLECNPKSKDNPRLQASREQLLRSNDVNDIRIAAIILCSLSYTSGFSVVDGLEHGICQQLVLPLQSKDTQMVESVAYLVDILMCNLATVGMTCDRQKTVLLHMLRGMMPFYCQALASPHASFGLKDTVQSSLTSCLHSVVSFQFSDFTDTFGPMLEATIEGAERRPHCHTFMILHDILFLLADIAFKQYGTSCSVFDPWAERVFRLACSKVMGGNPFYKGNVEGFSLLAHLCLGTSKSNKTIFDTAFLESLVKGMLDFIRAQVIAEKKDNMDEEEEDVEELFEHEHVLNYLGMALAGLARAIGPLFEPYEAEMINSFIKLRVKEGPLADELLENVAKVLKLLPPERRLQHAHLLTPITRERNLDELPYDQRGLTLCSTYILEAVPDKDRWKFGRKGHRVTNVVADLRFIVHNVKSLLRYTDSYDATVNTWELVWTCCLVLGPVGVIMQDKSSIVPDLLGAVEHILYESTHLLEHNAVAWGPSGEMMIKVVLRALGELADVANEDVGAALSGKLGSLLGEYIGIDDAELKENKANFDLYQPPTLLIRTSVLTCLAALCNACGRHHNTDALLRCREWYKRLIELSDPANDVAEPERAAAIHVLGCLVHHDPEYQNHRDLVSVLDVTVAHELPRAREDCELVVGCLARVVLRGCEADFMHKVLAIFAKHAPLENCRENEYCLAALMKTINTVNAAELKAEWPMIVDIILAYQLTDLGKRVQFVVKRLAATQQFLDVLSAKGLTISDDGTLVPQDKP